MSSPHIVNQLYIKYQQLNVDKVVLTNMLAMVPQSEQQRLLTDTSFFCDYYYKTQKALQGIESPPTAPVDNNQSGFRWDFWNSPQQTPQKSQPPKPPISSAFKQSDEEIQMNRAIAESLKTNQQGSYEPLQVDQRARISGECIGLKNIGNTCYFNSLMQTLFRIPSFVQIILQRRLPPMEALTADATVDKKRKKASQEMYKSLQELFLHLVGSNQKYTDPSAVINRLVDEQAQPVKIGDQKDIIEVMVTFLERLEEATQDKNAYDDGDMDEGIKAPTSFNKQIVVKRLADLESSSKFNAAGRKGQASVFENLSARGEPQTRALSKAVSEQIDNDPLNNSMFEAGNMGGFEDAKMDILSNSVVNSEKSKRIKSTVLSLTLQGEIQKIFFGEVKSFIENGNKERAAGDNLFGPIILNPSSGDFYKAWETYLTTPIEELVSANLTKQPSLKRDYITNKPMILTFQINRVHFNLKKMSSEKNNSPFALPKIIYIDRFLHDNKMIINGLQTRVSQMEAEISQINTRRSSVKDTSQNIDLDSAIGSVLSLLQKIQNRDPSIPPGIIGHSMMMGVDQELLTLQQNIRSELSTLQQREDNIRRDMSSLFNKIQKTAYTIFSIIIHEGSAEVGHYYCFIRLPNKWVKFNDFHCKDVTEDEVFEIANGSEKSNANAYCVFYMREDVWRNSEPHTYQLESEGSRKGYYSYVSAEQQKIIKAKNEEFEAVGIN
jgi:ubiquitin carboxyl-terminal hydrolase 25/28